MHDASESAEKRPTSSSASSPEAIAAPDSQDQLEGVIDPQLLKEPSTIHSDDLMMEVDD